MTIIKKRTNSTCWQGCGKKGNHGKLLVGMQIGASTMKNHIEVLQKIKNRTTSNLTSGYIFKGNEKKYHEEVSVLSCLLHHYSQ